MYKYVLPLSVRSLVHKHSTWIFLVCLSRTVLHLSLCSGSWKADLDEFHQRVPLPPGFQLVSSIGRQQPEQKPEGRRKDSEGKVFCSLAASILASSLGPLLRPQLVRQLFSPIATERIHSPGSGGHFSSWAF